MVRLCFYNPHAVAHVMGDTLLSRLAEIFGANKKKMRNHNKKYAFLLHILKDKNYKTAIVVDHAGTSLITVLQKIPLIRNSRPVYWIISMIEVYIWCLLNGLNPFAQTIISRKAALHKDTDVLFGFMCFSELFYSDTLLEKTLIQAFTGNKLLHATHFYKSTKIAAGNVKKAGITHMVAEADLKKSPYFEAFFDFIKDVYVLPHVLRDRYVNTVAFQERKNACLALGTLVIESGFEKSNEDYLHFFKLDTLHPMRKAIFEHQHELGGLVDSLIKLHNEKRLAIMNESTRYRKNNIFKMLYDLFLIPEGKEYHQVDIVKKYNEYQMFIAPEETIGLPSVNVVEGMACGCAFIGLDHSMYRDSGMIPGEHYIAYDGTILGLKNQIAYYQAHPVELAVIAQKGYVFAKEQFSEKKMVQDFFKYAEALVAARL